MRKAILFILSAMIIFSSVSAERVGFEALIYPQQKNTEPSEWAKADIEKAAELGIINPRKGYNYQKPITREDFCEPAVNMIELCMGEISAEMPENSQDRIGDTDDENVKKLFGAGIVNGKSYTKSGVVFAPDYYITREESAAILYRAVQYMNLALPQSAYTDDMQFYDDKNEISDWAFDAVFYMREMGIMKGTSDTEFTPKAKYTAEQAIVTIVRIYDAYKSQP